jgi:hypothetical protein
MWLLGNLPGRLLALYKYALSWATWDISYIILAYKADEVSFPMGIFALYTMFTTYAVPLASLVIPHPSFFVPAILLFTRRRPPFPSIPNKQRLTFRVVPQDEAYARPTCLLRLPSTLVNVPYSVSAPECDSYKPIWRPSDRGSGVRHLDNDPKRAKAYERSCGR